tara:strand:+ start:44331 stop:47306 length:2976 start_codon:yes stop_codon:yes gene_type:complete
MVPENAVDSNDPFQADASTVHRGKAEPGDARRRAADQANGNDPAVGNASDSTAPPTLTPRPSGDIAIVGDAEAAQIAEAQTVIRGSSRAGSPDSQPAKRLDQTPASVAKVLQGTRLNHFLLEELIGGGGMGAVFRARDEQLDRTVAIKVIPFVGNDPDLQRRFRNEAQSAAKLDHPQIARVFEVGNYNDWHYIVFEYIRGTNIRDLVTKSGVLSIDDAVFFTCQLAEALQHAADRGIVHRDIKPSNVLISEDEKIKLVDMGLARSDSFDLSEDMTASGVTLGTFDYISPEQARDPRIADLRSDIYSLGCTLYFMLTGSPPYPGGTMLQKLLSHGNAPPPDARELRPQVSDDLVIVINKMLAKDPQDRYASGNDLVSDLREVAFRDGLKRSQGIPAVSVAEPSRVAAWLEHHAPWLIAATLLLLSTAWLQLISAASRDEFDLSVPSDLLVLRDALPSPEGTISVPLRPTTRGPALDATSTDAPAPDSSELPLNAAMPSPGGSSSGGPSLGGSASGGSASGGSASGSPPSGRSGDTNEFGTAEIVPADPFAAPPRIGSVPSTLELDADIDQSVFANASSVRNRVPPSLDDTPPRLIRVLGRQPSIVDPPARDKGTVDVPTLDEALALAKKHDVDHIEIAAAVIRSGPVRIEQDGLLITAAPEIGECTIEMSHDDSLAIQRHSMFDIGSNRIELEDIHFVWKIAGGDFDGGALVAISDNRLVRMTDCSMTIDNPSRLDAVYAFEVTPLKSPSYGSAPLIDPVGIDGATLPLVAIELNNVIIRGQMTMIHMQQAVELQLQWDNGLLAIDQRMIDTMGAAFQPSETASAMQLSLTRVTALVPQGLVRMRLGIGGQYPVAIDRQARSCVFVVDEGTPHFEISGLPSLADTDALLKLRGEANAYDVEPTLVDPFLLLSDDEGRVEVTRMDDLKSNPPAWSDETSPRWLVRWAMPRSGGSLSETATSQLSVDDFLQDGTVLSGFDPNRLPPLPQKISQY